MTVLGLLVALLLAACSGSSTSIEDQAGGGGAGGGSEQATQDTSVSCEPDETDGELALYNWSEYIDPELIREFRDEFDVDVVEDFFPNNEELLARI
jgi:spermidine/putrescine-binding protein